jgi:hypothetical protein
MDPIPDPLLLRISGMAGNRTRDLWICSKELWPLDRTGGHTLVHKESRTCVPKQVGDAMPNLCCEFQVYDTRTSMCIITEIGHCFMYLLRYTSFLTGTLFLDVMGRQPRTRSLKYERKLLSHLQGPGIRQTSNQQAHLSSH